MLLMQGPVHPSPFTANGDLGPLGGRRFARPRIRFLEQSVGVTGNLLRTPIHTTMRLVLRKVRLIANNA